MRELSQDATLHRGCFAAIAPFRLATFSFVSVLKRNTPGNVRGG